MPDRETKGWRVILLPDPHVSKRILPLRLTFTASEKSVRYDFVEFRVVRAGSEEAEIESITPLPFRLSLVLPTTVRGESSFSYEARFRGADARDAARAIELLSMLRSGCLLEIYSLELGDVLATASVEMTAAGSRPFLDALVLDAAAVCQEYHVSLRIPERIQKDDVLAISVLLDIVKGTPLPVDGFTGRLVKSREGEANVDRMSREQPLQVIAEYERLERQPTVFGVSVNTGPITVFGRGARIKHVDQFLQRYSEAKYGEAVPIAFSVSELRARRGASQEYKLFVAPDVAEAPGGANVVS
jgi:hypothetical protein